jgi:NAD(P)-dependent dehydrogenase (short-subunit alcohol dehydrogenase family)
VPSALVTGGSSGIGLAIARMLRDEGYDLTLAARKLDRLEAAGRELAAEIVSVDVRREDDCVRLVDAHMQRWGGLDVLVNSAGIGVAAPIADLSAKYWDLQLDVNLRGTFLVTQQALPQLRASRGLIVNLSSIAGTLATPGLSAYGASKAAVIAFTRTLVREEDANGVRATALCPAFVDTPMAEWSGIPGEDMIRPEDCAKLVRALLRLGPNARVPLIVVERAGDRI